MTPAVSVIIPVRNGGPVFKRCLAALNQSSARPFEVLVADDGSHTIWRISYKK